MGEYKGSGLALMIGLLAGVLNGAAFGRDVVDFNADDKSETNTGHFMVAVDIARFCRCDFHRRGRSPLHDLRASQAPARRRRDPAAGRPPRGCRDERLRDGVPMRAACCAARQARGD